MAGAPHDDSGFSLMELIVVCALLGVTLAGAYTMLTAVSIMSNKMSARATATDESQVFIGTIQDELLQANSLKSLASTSTANADAQGAFYDIRPRQIGFYADLDHNGKPVRIAYYVSGASLMRQQAVALGTAYPYSWATSSTASPVISELDPDWQGPIFTYYGSGGWSPAPVTNASQVASITLVAVEVRNVTSWADQQVSYDASSTVRIRAIGNGY